MINFLSPHPYSLRHGGASDDALRGARTLASIKARGRWKSDNSVRRYEKHARVLREVERMPALAQTFGGRVMKSLSNILLDNSFALKPPGSRRGLHRRAPRAAGLPGAPTKRRQRQGLLPAAAT